jgi:hypothetical protein
MARGSTPAAAPTFLERVLGTYVRWVAGCVAAAFVYSVAVVAVTVFVRREHVAAAVPLIVYNTGSAMLLAAIVLAMIMIPYGYVVWSNQQWRFFGETMRWPTMLLRGAVVGAVVGVVLGLTWHG